MKVGRTLNNVFESLRRNYYAWIALPLRAADADASGFATTRGGSSCHIRSCEKVGTTLCRENFRSNPVHIIIGAIGASFYIIQQPHPLKESLLRNRHNGLAFHNFYRRSGEIFSNWVDLAA